MEAPKVTMLSAAKAYAAMGWKVFPLAVKDKIPLISKDDGGDGYHDASIATDDIETWWETMEPGANIGLPCSPNGLVAIDVDPRDGGDLTLKKLEQQIGPLPATLTANTGGGGLHYVFRAPDFTPKGKLGAGLDIKYNGYIVAAPSVHRSGGRYKWQSSPKTTEIATLPAAWLEAMKKPEPTSKKRSEFKTCTETTPYGRQALEAECSELAAMGPDTGRNNQLNTAAMKIGQLVAGGEVQEMDARRELGQAAEACGCPGWQATLKSGFSAGMNEPRSAPEDTNTKTDQATLMAEWNKDSHNHQADPGPVLREGEWRIRRLQDTWPEVLAELKKRADGGYQPVSTGLPSLDQLLGGGLPRGATTILTAPPGFGKSSWALALCIDRARQGVPTIFWSLELTSTDAHSRLVCIEHEKPWSDVRIGAHLAESRMTADMMSDLPMSLLDCDQLPIDKLPSAIRQMAAMSDQAPLVAIDYCQLLSDPATEKDARVAAEKVAKSLLDLAKDTDSAMLLLSSVGRWAYKNKGDDPDDYRGMAKESGRWESDAAVELSIVPRTVKGPRDKRGWFMCSKNRLGGPTGKVAVSYDGLAGRWSEIPEDAVPGKGSGISEPEMKSQILVALSNGDYKSLDSIKKVVSGDNNRKHGILQAMQRNGEIKKDESGHFRRANELSAKTV